MAALIASQGLFLPSYIFPASRCLHEAIQASYVVFARGSELILQFIAVECSVGFPAAALASLESVTARVVRVNYSPARPAAARGRTGDNPPVMGGQAAEPSNLFGHGPDWGSQQ